MEIFAWEEMYFKLQSILEPDSGSSAGERENAERAIERLKKKHHITDDMLKEIERRIVWFKYRDEHEQSILIQFLAFQGFVSKDNRTVMAINDDKGKRMGEFVGQVADIELQDVWNRFIEQWRAELKIFAQAFCIKHRLTRRKIEGEDVPEIKMAHGDVLKLMGLADYLDDIHTGKQIGNG